MGANLPIGLDAYIHERGNIVFGERCALGSFARIWNYAPVEVGDDFFAAGGLTPNSATHDAVILTPEGKLIRMGNRVWCGVDVTIPAGVTVAANVVIGAGSVVTEHIPANYIAVGVPRNRIKNLAHNDKTQVWTPVDPF